MGGGGNFALKKETNKKKAYSHFQRKENFWFSVQQIFSFWKRICFSYLYRCARREKAVSVSSICCISIYTLYVSATFWLYIKRFKCLPPFLPYSLWKKKFTFWPPDFIYDHLIPSNLLFFQGANHSFCGPRYRNPATLLILPTHACGTPW